MIFKRKSFHLFRNVGHETISSSELESIQQMYDTFTPLCPDIKTAIRIVPADKVSFYNQIDIGIFLCFLELCMQKENINYEKLLYVDSGSDIEKTLTAVYKLIK
ncbi:MAG: hypothetical protein PHX08_16435 [Lachnospiraceae bacterium]|nr:hypothetical protein [Lachnospiraceae bacterium]